MRVPAARLFLRLLGGLVAAAGLLAWVGLLWEAIAEIDAVTPESDEGGRLMARALTGTVLMIAGMILLHFAADAEEREEREAAKQRRLPG